MEMQILDEMSDIENFGKVFTFLFYVMVCCGFQIFGKKNALTLFCAHLVLHTLACYCRMLVFDFYCLVSTKNLSSCSLFKFCKDLKLVEFVLRGV